MKTAGIEHSTSVDARKGTISFELTEMEVTEIKALDGFSGKIFCE
jgi:hypothetical protein